MTGSTSRGTSSSSASGTKELGRIAYGRFDPGSIALFTANADGTDTKPLRSGLPGEQPHFSPDGRLIALTASQADVVTTALMRVDGSEYRMFMFTKGPKNLVCVFWSPDGRRLACEGFDDDDPGSNGVYTVNSSDGSDLQRVTHHRDIPCAFSPDGAKVLFLRSNPTNDADNELMVTQADGSGTATSIRKGVGLSCDWSPDGSSFLAEAGGKQMLIDRAGTVTVLPLDVTSASRGSFSPGGDSIIFSGTSGGRDDIYTSRLDGTALTQITHTPEADEEFGDRGP